MARQVDNLVIISASALLVAVAYTGFHINRRERSLLVAAYIGYIAWLWPK